MISCDAGICKQDLGLVYHEHELSRDDGGDPRLDPRLINWALDVGGNDVDICPYCRQRGGVVSGT